MGALEQASAAVAQGAKRGPLLRAGRLTLVRVAWIAPLLLAALAAVCALPLSFAGGFHDDGVYLATARALAEGRGYVIGSLPGEFPQTKYPVLFPGLLAALWKIWPAFPDNLALLRLVPLLSTAGWLLALWRLVGAGYQRPLDARWLITVTACAPLVIEVSGMPLSEPLYAFVSALALLALQKASDNAGGYRHVALSALLCAAAYHTRTIGVSLLPCALLALPPWKRPRQTLLFVSLWIALCAPWIGWQSLHPAPADPVLAYYTNKPYLTWALNGAGWESVLQTAAMNVAGAAIAPLTFWELPKNLVVIWLSAIGAGLSLFGLFTQLGRRERLAAVWVLATLAIALLWPWPPQRFLLPVLPFAVLAAADSAPVQRLARTRWAGPAVVALLISWGLAVSAANAGRSLQEGVPFGPFGMADVPWRDHEEAYRWIRTATPPAARLAGNIDPNYWLYAERRAVRAFAVDPRKLFYSPDAPAGALGPSEALLRLLHCMAIDYLVLEKTQLFSEIEPFEQQLAEVSRRRPGLLSAAFASKGGRILIYRVDRSLAGP
ncbi:MAG: hypothetical protein SFV54_16930 [Bryobacteraceae bacterium]|nr:hypothetical protein [Bryobacteraceae bacterium]